MKCPDLCACSPGPRAWEMPDGSIVDLSGLIMHEVQHQAIFVTVPIKRIPIQKKKPR